MKDKEIVIGIDIGGSHITCLGVDHLSGRIIPDLCIRRQVDSHSEAGLILAVWAGALKECISTLDPGRLSGICFAMPGPFDYREGVALFAGVRKYDSLRNINIRDEIRRRLSLPSTLPLRFLNDATCFAIGEAWLGKAAGYHRTMVITLGTGFGSAFLEDGIPVESGPEVPPSGCLYHLAYGDTIADDYFSSRWFGKEYNKRFRLPSPGVKIMTDLAETDAGIREIFTEFGNRLALFIAPAIKAFRPDCLTIGGNIARSYPFFGPRFHETLDQEKCIIKIFLSDLGEQAAILGSARLADDTFFSKLPFISNK